MKSIKKGGLSRRISVGLAGARGGLGLLQARASGLLLPKDKQAEHQANALSKEAMKFVAHLGELKGAYVKIGQMLALYGEHILPAPVTEALHTLESGTKPLDWQSVKPALLEELGEEQLERLEVKEVAMAAASLAQVHRCDAGENGTQLCLKIQYPGISDTIEDDFNSVAQMLSLARWVNSAQQLNALLTEIKAFLLKEVDYLHELQTAQRVAKLVEGDGRYRVPRYFPEISTSKLLAMEYIDAEQVTSAKVQSLSQERRNKLAESMLELFFKEAFDWRLMQTDPNFGNYRIVVGHNDDQLVLLDFGAVHELPADFCAELQSTIIASQQQRTEDVVNGLIRLNCLSESDSNSVKQSFATFCEFILEPFRESLDSAPDFAIANGAYDWRRSKLLRRAGKLGSQGMLIKGFTVPPPEFMLMVRKLTGVFTFVSKLGAKTHSAHLLNKYRI